MAAEIADPNLQLWCDMDPAADGLALPQRCEQLEYALADAECHAASAA